MSRDQDILVDLMKETRDDVKHMKQVQMRQEADIRRNADSLVEHMRRTDLLEESVDLQKKRLDSLETPNKVLKHLFDWFVKIGVGASTMWGILKLVEHLKL